MYTAQIYNLNYYWDLNGPTDQFRRNVGKTNDNSCRAPLVRQHGGIGVSALLGVSAQCGARRPVWLVTLAVGEWPVTPFAEYRLQILRFAPAIQTAVGAPSCGSSDAVAAAGVCADGDVGMLRGEQNRQNCCYLNTGR